jgi:hypothetical protein
MRGSASFLTVLMFSVVVTFQVANLSSAEAKGGNCEAKLVGNSYDCTLNEPPNPPVPFCAEFETGGISVNFDLFLISTGTSDLGCVCDTTGSFKSPKIDGSSSVFECVDETGTQLNGKIKGKKLDGQASDAAGMSAIYTCTERSTACP